MTPQPPEHPSDANRLADASSAYLRAHAEHPVHWQPWDDAALEEAERRDLPILLSIGYSACHWCHVMADESFADPRIAAVMNEHFVCIKVDRQERADLDRVYQTTHQILTRQPGGWPLTAFLDPADRRPFFSGTYFPPTPRMGAPALSDLLANIARLWSEDRDALREQGAKVQQILDTLNAPEAPEAPTATSELASAFRRTVEARYDRTDGGFGGPPKFPMPTLLARLLQHWSASRSASAGADGDALEMVMHTLTRMARGGLFDHLGGGFFRYATDRAWVVPHFEKMLHDNGSLLAIYADAVEIAPDALLTAAVDETADWLLREMQRPDGAFCASLDADGGGGEGRYYTWHREEARRVLDADGYELLETLYGIDKPANFEGRWILHRRDAWRAVVERLGLSPEDAADRLARMRRALLDARAKRPAPRRDERALAGWNGLALGGLARAARVRGREDWLDAALRCADFLRERLAPEGALLAHDGDGSIRGLLEDHALVLEGLLALLAVHWRDVDARFALRLGTTIVEDFEDRLRGGFFHTAHGTAALIHRPKPWQDDAMPAGAAAAARALQRLGRLFAREDFVAAAHRALDQAMAAVERAPEVHGTAIDAIAERDAEPELVIIRGPDAERWAQRARDGFQPDRLCYALPPADDPDPLLPERIPASRDGTAAWLCSNGICTGPLTDVDALVARLGGGNVVTLRPR